MAHVRGARRRYLAELVGRRRRHAALPVRLARGECRQQRLRDRMRRAADADAVLPAADRVHNNASISRRASGGTSAAQYDTSPCGAMCTMTG
ncbi:hypothetical protein G6F46_014785 [Rhizopus delemar]|nr:hypothetical protein G6F46_014785 [Rhizopus delemar]